MLRKDLDYLCNYLISIKIGTMVVIEVNFIREIYIYIYIWTDYKKKRKSCNSEGCSSTDQVLDLLTRYHRFESYKPQGH